MNKVQSEGLKLERIESNLNPITQSVLSAKKQVVVFDPEETNY